MVLTWWLASPGALTSDRINFMYLSTLTRSSGLLLGAGAAFVWRPWRAKTGVSSGVGLMLNVAGLAATAGLIVAFINVHLTDRSLFRWQLALVSILSIVVVGAVVHPAATATRSFFGRPALVSLGKRSYGLYLWSWPIMVLCGAYVGSWSRFIAAMSITIVVAEFSYLYIETPIRKGALGRWFARHPDSEWAKRTLYAAVAGVVVIASLGVFYSHVQRFARAAGARDVAIDLSRLQSAQPPPTAAVATNSTQVA